uniref:Uncharacterized protein n=1 Tax=viral metagenome TaxID=1070528 RepID=A0A6M3LM02_9ZZZZ
MEKVEIYKWERPAGITKMVKVKETEGMFIEFGCDYMEFESGAGNYSTGIVEMPDGSIRNVPVELLKFIR